MLWKISNFLSAAVASFVSKDKITAILLKRSLFIAINRFLSVVSLFVVACMALFVVYFAFNFTDYKDKIRQKASSFAIQIQNHSLFKNHMAKQIDISVSDTVVVNRIDINRIIEKYKTKKPIMFIDIDEIAAEIKTLPFVKDVYIRRKFFNSIQIVVFEKDVSFVIKILDKNQIKLMTLDSDGKINDLPNATTLPEVLADRPAITSPCNNESFIKSTNELYKILLNYNSLYKRIKEMNFYNCKNWHVYLTNGDLLVLGDSNTVRGIYKYITNYDKINNLQDAPHRIDLRFDGKIYIKSLIENDSQQ